MCPSERHSYPSVTKYHLGNVQIKSSHVVAASIVVFQVNKTVYHLEQAAIGGQPQARVVLAVHEKKNGRPDRAAKHFIINANLGCHVSLQQVKDFFVQGIVSKDEYAAALRGHQATVNETKSAEREKGEAFYKARDARFYARK
jgi:hypothetical protein